MVARFVGQGMSFSGRLIRREMAHNMHNNQRRSTVILRLAFTTLVHPTTSRRT